MAGDENEQRRGQELRQPDHAEIEGAAGEVVDLPADRTARDLAGEARKASRQQEEQERPVPEQFAGARPVSLRTWQSRWPSESAVVNGRARNTALRGARRWHNRFRGSGGFMLQLQSAFGVLALLASHGRQREPPRGLAAASRGRARRYLLSPRWCCSSCRRSQKRSAPSTTPSHDLGGDARRYLLRVRLSRRRRAAFDLKSPGADLSWRFRRCRSSWS